jgi:hypothetical protein
MTASSGHSTCVQLLHIRPELCGRCGTGKCCVIVLEFRRVTPLCSQQPFRDGQYYTGAIPEANVTYNVVGNVNEWGVVITETTFGGRGDLDGHGTGAIMSYGDLIFTTLTRARSAREAIRIMDELCQARWLAVVVHLPRAASTLMCHTS